MSPHPLLTPPEQVSARPQSLVTCLLFISFWSKPMTVIFHSGSSTSGLGWFCLQSSHWRVVTLETPHWRRRNATASQGTPSICCSYAVHTPQYANDQNSTLFNRIRYPMDKEVCHRFAVTTFNTPNERARYTNRIAVAFQAIKLRLWCVAFVFTAHVWRTRGFNM